MFAPETSCYSWYLHLHSSQRCRDSPTGGSFGPAEKLDSHENERFCFWQDVEKFSFGSNYPSVHYISRVEMEKTFCQSYLINNHKRPTKRRVYARCDKELNDSWSLLVSNSSNSNS